MAKKILLVDDEPHIITMLENRMKHAGYEVITAVDGQDALMKAQKEKPDLIILYLMLPSCMVSRSAACLNSMKNINISL